MKKLTSYLFLLIILSSCWSCSSVQPFQKGQTEFLFAAYNVENLFDNEHDQGKEDFAYLPKDSPFKAKGCEQVESSYWKQECFAIDWTEEKLRLKLEQIKRVVLSLPGGLPEFLALSEIENEVVVKKLAESLGYNHYRLSDGPDERGIDTALMWVERSDLKFISSREIPIASAEFPRPTRPILEVEFLVADIHPLTVFVNHWPSQGSPNEYRLLAAKILKERVQALKRENPRRAMILAGDFNVIDANNPNAINDVLLSSTPVFDLHDQVEDKSLLAPGTYFFKRGGSWNLLDRIFVSENFKGVTGLKLSENSFGIHQREFMTEEIFLKDDKAGERIKGVPKRYNFEATKARDAGFSDHFPIYFRFWY